MWGDGEGVRRGHGPHHNTWIHEIQGRHFRSVSTTLYIPFSSLHPPYWYNPSFPSQLFFYCQYYSLISKRYNLSGRNRKLKYKDTKGNDVEVVIDVPWGLSIHKLNLYIFIFIYFYIHIFLFFGRFYFLQIFFWCVLYIGEEVEEVDEGTWRHLIQHNPRKPPTKRSRSEKRMRDDAGAGAGASDAAHVPKVGKVEGGDAEAAGEKKRRMDDSREEQEDEEEGQKRRRVDENGEEEEGVYEHVELGPYGMDGGANLDFREEDEAYDNLGDYETMRGQIGDEDGIPPPFLPFSLPLFSLSLSSPSSPFRPLLSNYL